MNRNGWLQGGLGVLIFSGSLPATRVAVAELDPVFLTLTRAVIAGILAAFILLLLRQRLPQGRQWLSITVVVIGVVAGFPLLTALALQHVSAAHALVYMGLLPLQTAIFGVWRSREKPAARFWLFSVSGGALVVTYALTQGVHGLGTGDLLMLTAIVVCGLGYAEGAQLAKSLGGWQVICWALLLALPFSVGGALWAQPTTLAHVHWPAWASVGYVSVFSMLIGFFFWYSGLARGGTAAVGQLQLLQPFLGFGLAAMLLEEPITPAMMVTTCAVLLCVAGARWTATPRSPAVFQSPVALQPPAASQPPAVSQPPAGAGVTTPPTGFSSPVILLGSLSNPVHRSI